MASNSSDRQLVAQHRLRIITGHLQRPVDGDTAIIAEECKAQGTKQNVSSEERTMPRRRYKAEMEPMTTVHPSHVVAFSYVFDSTLMYNELYKSFEGFIVLRVASFFSCQELIAMLIVEADVG